MSFGQLVGRLVGRLVGLSDFFSEHITLHYLTGIFTKITAYKQFQTTISVIIDHSQRQYANKIKETGGLPPFSFPFSDQLCCKN